MAFSFRRVVAPLGVSIVAALSAGCGTAPAPCLPALDVCNGVDDDCDGIADEGFSTGAACSVGLGACRGEGHLACAANALSAVCDAAAGTPAAETCNGVDDDCDGSVDEQLPGCCAPGETRPCGAVADVGVCRAGAEKCSAEHGWSGACLDVTGVAVVFPGARDERCNGEDDDCDGATDEGFAAGESCSAGTGACFAAGHLACLEDGSAAACDAVAAPPVAESCNGVDDDCDDAVDEDGAAGCTERWIDGDGDGYGSGAARCLCVPGGGYVATLGGDCDDRAGQEAVHPGALELCNGIDDDCDGSVDEGYDVGTSCSAGLGACLRGALTRCTADGTGTSCPAVAGEAAPETCNGVDDDCDGASDEGSDAELCGSGAHTTSATCSAGACLLSCEAGWYDEDALAADGCECQQDTLDVAGQANDCAAPLDLGALLPGQQLSRAGNVVPAGDQDWFVFTASPAAVGKNGEWWICVRLDPAYPTWNGLLVAGSGTTPAPKCGDHGYSGGGGCFNNPDGQVRYYYVIVDRPWSAPLPCTTDGVRRSSQYVLQVKGYTTDPTRASPYVW